MWCNIKCIIPPSEVLFKQRPSKRNINKNKMKSLFIVATSMVVTTSVHSGKKDMNKTTLMGKLNRSSKTLVNLARMLQ